MKAAKQRIREGRKTDILSIRQAKGGDEGQDTLTDRHTSRHRRGRVEESFH